MGVEPVCVKPELAESRQLPGDITAMVELQHEVEAIGRAVDEGGPVSRDELFHTTGARRWGPGRFRRALDEAVAAGRIRRTGRRRFEPPESGS